MTLALIAGGGTGGHLSIAIAIAQAISQMAPGQRILLLGCRMESDAPMLKESGFPFHIIPARPWPRALRRGRFCRCVWGALLALTSGLLALGSALVLLRRERPRVVIGTGGYGSAPAVLAAWVLRLPTLIHEADSVAGLANRFLARFARAITLGYDEAFGAWCRQRAKVSGNPVRRAFRTLGRSEARLALGINPAWKLIVAFGGSQGAESINQAFFGAAESFLKNGEARLLHASGRRDYTTLKEQIEKMDPSLRPRYWLRPFLGEQEMASALMAADLVVMRAGASALAEVAATGTPAVIVPYPFARRKHQASNAKSLLKRGQAVLLEDQELNPGALLDAAETIWRTRSGSVDRPAGDAAKEIASLALSLAEGRFAFTGAMG